MKCTFTRRELLRLVAAGSGAAVLAACGTQGGQTGTQTTQAPAVVSQPGSKVKITY
ncbi:MAG: hypothetical protein ACP5UR_16700 [Chloroflexus sp.]|uniref:hypothetical protein n=1 Tax=Chloroflexus sp. TaxID=1904827 RepID=UPI003D122BEB